MRNNVHPGVWAKDRTNPLRFTKDAYGVVDEVIDVANSWLLHRINKDLLKTISRAERKQAKLVGSAVLAKS